MQTLTKPLVSQSSLILESDLELCEIYFLTKTTSGEYKIWQKSLTNNYQITKFGEEYILLDTYDCSNTAEIRECLTLAQAKLDTLLYEIEQANIERLYSEYLDRALLCFY